MGPFWSMLILAVLAAFYYYGVGRPRIAGSHLRPLTLFLFCFWPTLLFSEAVFYRMVRKRIVYPGEAWLHISCMWYCFVIFPLLRVLIFRYLNEFVSLSERRRMVSVISTTLVLVYWASIIVGHVFFGMMAKRALAKPETPSQNTDTVNLLDDVLN